MKRFGVLIVAVAVLLLPSSALGEDPPTLTAIVGDHDGFNITLNDASGLKVRRLLPGTYTVIVDDRSTIHNFHLASNDDPTVDFRTDLEFVGKQSFTVTFRNGDEYAYACEPHWRTMSGSFLVTDAPPPPPPPPPPPVRKLTASVSAAGAVRLSSSSVPHGRFKITVSDRSKKANFHLSGKGVNKRTGMRFKGSTTWTVTLRKGTYAYGNDKLGLNKKLKVR